MSWPVCAPWQSCRRVLHHAKTIALYIVVVVAAAVAADFVVGGVGGVGCGGGDITRWDVHVTHKCLGLCVHRGRFSEEYYIIQKQR